MKLYAKKVGGNYEAYGWVVAEFRTTADKQRIVFEFEAIPGMLHIFNPEQIAVVVGAPLGTVPYLAYGRSACLPPSSES